MLSQKDFKMKNLKILSIVTLVSLGIVTPIRPAHAFMGVGDVVFDPANTAQAIEQVSRMKQQYDMLKKTYDAISGATNMGKDLKAVKNVIPGSWQEVVSIQKSGGLFKNKQEVYTKILTVIGEKDLERLKKDNTVFKGNFEAVRTGMAVSEASYDALSERIQRLEQLSAKINQTKNIKEAQDLGNAIAIEQAQIQVITAQLASVQNNMTANTANQQVAGGQVMSTWLR